MASVEHQVETGNDVVDSSPQEKLLSLLALCKHAIPDEGSGNRAQETSQGHQ